MIRKAVATVVAALLLTGCGETTVGVAARVGDRAIESQSLAGLVNRAYEDGSFTRTPREVFQLRVLARLVTANLVEVAARRRGVSVTESRVDEEIKNLFEQVGGEDALYQAAAAEGVPRADLRDAVREAVLEDLLKDDLVKDVTVTDAQLAAQYKRLLPQYDTAEVAHILVRNPREAQTVARLARAPGADFAALAVKYSADTETSAAGGNLGVVGNGQGRFAKEFEEAVFSAQTGDVVGPIRIVSQGDAKVVDYEIVKVVKRTTRQFEQVRDEVRRSLLDEERERRFTTLIEDLSRELGVKVNPRFGRWEAKTRQVVPGDGNALSSPSPPPGVPEPAGGLPPGTLPGGGPAPTPTP